MNVLSNMLQDGIVRDSMKIFVSELISRNDGMNHSKMIMNNLEKEIDLKSMKNEHDSIPEELDTEGEIVRVEKLTEDYIQNNPFIKLNFFKNKVKIPVSFTFRWRGDNRTRYCRANLFVGSEICICILIYSWNW
jgi:hypothetical protein